MKLKIRLDDPETRAVWEAAKKAKAEVESWPTWKRSQVEPEPGSSIDSPAADDATDGDETS